MSNEKGCPNDEHDVVGSKTSSPNGATFSVPSVGGSGFNGGGVDLGGDSKTNADSTGPQSILNDAGINPGIP